MKRALGFEPRGCINPKGENDNAQLIKWKNEAALLDNYIQFSAASLAQ